VISQNTIYNITSYGNPTARRGPTPDPHAQRRMPCARSRLW
jgi:hypothetical protein